MSGSNQYYQLVIQALETQDTRILTEFFRVVDSSVQFNTLVLASIQILKNTQNTAKPHLQFTAQTLSGYLQKLLPDSMYQNQFIEIIRKEKLTDLQLDYLCHLLQALQEKTQQQFNFQEFFSKIKQALQKNFNSDLLNKLFKYGFNSSFRQVFEQICPAPTVNDGGQLLMFFATPVSVNKNKYSLSQIEKEFDVELFDEAVDWKISDVFVYLKEKGVNIIQCVQKMTMDEIYYSPQQLLELTIKAYLAQNPRSCFCSKCSNETKESLIDLIFGGFELNNYVRFSYCIGFLTLAQTLTRAFNTKVYLQLRQGLSQETLKQFLLLQQYAFFVNFGRLEQVQLVYSPNLQNNDFKCPFQYALDICGYVLEQKFGQNTTKRSCIQNVVLQITDLDQLMLNQQQAVILTQAFVWRSIPLIKTLKLLYPIFPAQIEYLLHTNLTTQSQSQLQQELVQKVYGDPIVKCPEQLSLTILQLQPSYFLKSIISLALNKYFNNTTKQFMSPILVQALNTSEYFPFIYQMVWQYQPTQSLKMLEYSIEFQCLDLVLNSTDNFYFVLDVAVLASSQNKLNLPQFLNTKLMQHGISFMEALSVFTIKKILKQNKQIDLQDYYYIHNNSQSDIQCSLHDILIYAKQSSQPVSFDSQLKFVHITDSVIINEQVVYILYRFIIYYGPYFTFISQCQLKTRLQKLCENAQAVIKIAQPKIDMVMAQDLQVSDSITNQNANSQINQFFKDLNIPSFIDLQKSSQKTSLTLKSMSFNVLNLVLKSLTDLQLIKQYHQDQQQQQTIQQQIFILSGDLFINQLFFDVLLPKFLEVFFKVADSNQPLALLTLKQIINNSKKLKNTTDTYYSFFEAITTLPIFNTLDFESQQVVLHFSDKNLHPQQKILESITNELNQQREDNNKRLQNSDKLIQSNFLDDDITQFITSNNSPMKLLISSQQETGVHYEIYNQKMWQILNNQQLNENQRIQFINECKLYFEKDKQQFAEFFVSNYLIENNLKDSFNRGVSLAQFFNVFRQLNSQSLLQIIAQQMILSLSRLIFSSQPLTIAQLRSRRQKASLLGIWLGASQFRHDLTVFKGLKITEFDGQIFCKMGEFSGTLSVYTVFFYEFSKSILLMNPMMTPYNGFLLTLLSQILTAAECPHGFFCKSCREIAKVQNENSEDNTQFLIYQDLDNVISDFYSESICEIIPDKKERKNAKKVIILPEFLQEEANLSVLMKSAVNEVPLNLTAALVHENEELLWHFDCVQICLRQGKIQQIWSKYVDNARECAENLLAGFGLKQSDPVYKKAYSMATNRITNVLIRNASLQAFSEEILQEILNRFKFEDWVPQELQELIQEKILRQLSLMAAEQVIQYVQKQAQQVQQIKVNNNTKLSAKLDFQLAETCGIDESTTPYDDRLVASTTEFSLNQQVNEVEEFCHIFSIKAVQYDKNTWDELLHHDNTAIFPYTMVNYPELLITCNWSSYQPANQSYQQQSQQFISKQLNTSVELTVQEQVNQFISNYQFTSNLQKYQVIKYVQNSGMIINHLGSYLPLTRSLTLDESIKLLARLCKSIYSIQSQLVVSSYSSSNISIYNIQANHPLNAQLHALRLVFNQLWRLNAQQCRQFMNTLFNWVISGISIDALTVNLVKSCQIKCDIQSSTQNSTTIKQIRFVADNKMMQQVNQSILNYQRKMKTDFLSLFDSDVQIHKHFQEDHQQIVRHICDTASSCSNQISLQQSLPFAIYQIIAQVYKDNSSSAIDLKQQISLHFQHLIEMSVYFDILKFQDQNYSVHDCLTGFYTGLIKNQILSPEDVDKLYHDSFTQALQHPASMARPSGATTTSIQNKCVLTISAAAQSLCTICFNNNKELVQVQKSTPSHLFKLTTNLIEELYTTSYETLALTITKSQKSTGQNETIFATSLELPDVIQEFLFYQQNINQGHLSQRSFSGDDLADFGFNLQYSDFNSTGSILQNVQNLQPNIDKFTKYIAEIQKKTTNSFTMLDNFIMECFKNFSQILDQKIDLTGKQVPVLSNCIRQIHQVGIMVSDEIAAKIFDSVLISCFYTIFNDCGGNALVISRKSLQIDQLGQFLYFIIQSIPEIEYQGNAKQQYLTLLLYRIQQLYSVFQSFSVSAENKLLIMKQLRNYDLLDQTILMQQISSQTVQDLKSEIRLSEQIDNGEKLPQQTFFNILAIKFTHKLLFSIQRIFLSQTNRFNKYHRIQFSTVIAQSLYQYRPQYHPEFFSTFVSLLSEPTLMGTMLTYQADYLFSEHYDKYLHLNFIKQSHYKKSPTFQPYFMILQAFCMYTHSYFSNIELIGIGQLKQYTRCLMRLIIIISKDFPEFMSQYRIIISESLHLNAQQLRNYLNSNNDYPQTDEVNGILSIPETDFIEDLVMSQLNKELEIVLRRDSDSYVKDVIACLKNTVFNPIKIDQIAPFLNYLIKYQFYSQLDRKKVEDTHCYQIIYQLLRDLVQDSAKQWVIVQMSVFVSGPSIETYCFASILQALAKCQYIPIVNLVKEILEKRVKGDSNWGCNVLARSLYRKGWK